MTLSRIWFVASFLAIWISTNAQNQYLMYERSYGPGEGEQLLYADELPSKDIVIIGYRRSDIIPSPFEGFDYYVARLDSNLNLLWEKSIGDSNIQDFWGNILKSKDGNYVFAGVREFSPAGNYRGVRTLSVDSNGTVLWEKYYSGGYWDEIHQFVQMQDGCFMLACGINYSGWDREPTLIKIDELGNEIWRKAQDSLLNYVVHYMAACPDGGVVTLGYKSNSNTKSYIAKYDSVGDLVWIKYPYGLNDTIPYSLGGIFTKSDGTIVVLFPERHPLFNVEQTFWREYDQNGNMTNEYLLRMYLFANQSTWNSPPLNLSGDKMIACTTPYNNGGAWLVPFDLERNFGVGAHITDRDSVTLLKGISYGIQLHDGGFFGVGASGTINDPPRFYFVKFAPDGRYQAASYSSSVEINPNPSSDGNFLMQFDSQKDETVQINIWSVTGALIYSYSLFCPANTQTDLRISLERSSSPSGMYFFEAVTEEYTLRKQLVVARSGD